MNKASPPDHHVLQQHALHQMQSRMQRWRVLAIVLVSVLTVSYSWQPLQTWWQQHRQQEDHTDQAAIPPEKIHTVTTQVMENRITLDGTIVPLANVELNAPLPSTVKKIVVRYGETVHKGDLLFELEPRADLLSQAMNLQLDYKMELQNLKDMKHIDSSSEVSKARRGIVRQKRMVQDAERKLAENKLLFQQGVIAQSIVESSEQNLSDMRMMLDEAQEILQEVLAKGSARKIAMQTLKLEAIQNNLKEIEFRLKQRMIYAPIDGVLLQPLDPRDRQQRIEVTVGQYLGQNAPLAQIANMSQLRVVSSVEDDTVVKYSVGLKAKVTSRTLPGAVLDGYTDSVSREPLHMGGDDMGAVRYAVGILIPQLSDAQRANIRIGMKVEADVELSAPYETLVIPIDGVHVWGGKRQVTIIRDDGSMDEVDVVTGVTKLTEVEIRHGLKAGDRIVLTEF